MTPHRPPLYPASARARKSALEWLSSLNSLRHGRALLSPLPRALLLAQSARSRSAPPPLTTAADFGTLRRPVRHRPVAAAKRFSICTIPALVRNRGGQIPARGSPPQS